MANYVLCLFLQRILIPLFLIATVISRPVGFSFGYLFFLFALPYVPVATSHSLRGWTGIYLKALIVVSALFCLILTFFYATIAIMHAEYVFKDGSLLRHVGFVNFYRLSFLSFFHWIIPDFIMLIVSILLFTLLKKLSKNRKEEQNTLKSISISNSTESAKFVPQTYVLSEEKQNILVSMAKYSSLFALFLSGAIQPSLPSLVYFGTFLAASTWLGCNLKLEKTFGIILKFISWFQILHIFMFIFYQNPWPQDALKASDLTARLLGLYKIFVYTKETFNELQIRDNLEYDQILNPIVLLTTYLIISLSSDIILEKERKKPSAVEFLIGSLKRKSKTQKQLLKEHKRRGKVNKKKTDDETDVDCECNEGPLNKYHNIKVYGGYVYKQFCELVYNNFYIVTNVSMMIWSIVYHSWFGFVLLIWANAVWIASNQREILLKTSPFLVAYAVALILINFIYGFNLTDDEFPDKVSGINLIQIGLIKNTSYPVYPLFIKSLFTISFWVSLRQMIIERNDTQKRIAIARVYSLKAWEERDSEIVKRIAKVLNSICVVCWMWIIIAILFSMASIGDKMTVLRIIDMTFFFVYLFVFQVSLKWWIKSMYVFWSTLIIYSMTVLVLVYSYQFDSFPAFWDSMDISLSLQEDLGFKQYKTKDLFLKLLTFTSVIILTALQLNYYHKEFMKMLEPASRESSGETSEQTSTDTYPLLTSFQSRIEKAFEVFLLLLEIHFYKIIFILTFGISLWKIHTINLVIMFLALIGIQTKSVVMKRIIVKIILITSMLFIYCIMFYQLENVVYPEEECESNVSVMEININLKDWFGFSYGPIFTIIWPYFLYIVLITLNAGLIRRQQRKRHRMNKPKRTPYIVFENISRADAENKIIDLMKFIVNYCFYKFGVELTLVMFMIVILHRMDAFAFFYAFWFCIITFKNPSKLEQVWRHTIFWLTISIILQCLLLNGIPPHRICLDEQTQLFFHNKFFEIIEHNWKHEYVVVFDFILLMMMSCQLTVFKMNRHFNQKEPLRYGGSNRLIYDTSTDNERFTLLAENPLMNFTNKIKKPIDVLKGIVFKSTFWTSLTVVFLAGTDRVDLFSLGYLAGSFTFFWCGTDFYLKPMKNIMKWWNLLLAYNMFVIVMKVCAKFFGCLYGSSLPKSICWMVEFLGIPCIIDTKELFCDNLLNGHDLLWDGIAFVVLIFQRRIFLSFYFCYIVDETVKTDILSSRGAELIEELRVTAMIKENATEAATLEQIKLKMEKLKLVIKKVDEVEPEFHHQAIRSCDYSMFDEADDVDVVDEVLEHNEPLLSASDLLESTVPKATDLETNEHKKRIKKLKKFLNKLTMQFVFKMHQLSRNYSFIIKVLAHERKCLNAPLDADLTESKSSIGRMLINKKKEKQLSIMARIDQLFLKYHPGKKVGSTNDIIMIELIKETFYLLFSHTDLIVYLCVVLNQISSASVLALPLSLFVFLWGTLTFPRPSKAFWIVLIAYTQTVVLIKCVSQFEFLWWNRDESTVGSRGYIKLLGNERKPWFASYDLVLLLVIFIHRIVLKTFGLWKSFDDFELYEDGCYKLEETDEKTQDLIQYYFKHGLSKSQDSVKINDNNAEFNSSRDYLVQEDNLSTIKILTRHEHSIDETLKLPQIRHVYCNKNKLLKAKYDIDSDADGSLMVTLQQGHVNLKIRPLECSRMYKQPKEKCMIVENTVEEPSDFCPNIFVLSLLKHVSNVRIFINELVQKRSRKVVDVYKYMFICEFINFFVLLFGYSDFAIHYDENLVENNVMSFIEENKIPTSLLFILLIHFLMIVIERALYLRKNIIGKVSFHFCIIIATHIWMFFTMPETTGRAFNATASPVIYYSLKCIYLLLSAFQIRYGYPARILGNFLMKHYNLKHLIVFKLFMLTPFLYELRTLTDWVFTDTSLTFPEWLNVESIYAKIFAIKCDRNITLNIPRGLRTTKMKKYLQGGGLALFLIVIMWFPLALFAYSNALGRQNIPTFVSVSFRIGSFESIYEVEAERDNIFPFNNANWNNLSSIYGKHRLAYSFLNQFQPEDVVAVRLISNSSKVWNISPSQRDQLLVQLKSGSKISCRFSYTISHLVSSPFGQGRLSGSSDYTINSMVREQFINIFEDQNSTETVEIPRIFPKMLNVKSSGKIQPIPQLFWVVNSSQENKKFYYRNLTLKFHQTNYSEWWEIKEQRNDTFHESYYIHYPFGDTDKHLTMFLFSEKIFPGALNRLFVKGIMGLYLTVIVFSSRILRSTMFMNRASSIMFEELPNVDRILALCKDIYLVRESMDFRLEEDLYAKLIFLYRTPETLIKWSKKNE